MNDYSVNPTAQYGATSSPQYAVQSVLGGAPRPQPVSQDNFLFHTNNGDFAGEIGKGYAGPIRVIDPTNGQVIYEGTGPQAAAEATQLANGVSQSQGKKASWAVQIQPEPNSDWQTAAMDKVDTKHNLLGTLADIALPILGAILMPVTGGMSAALAAGLGSAGGSVVSSLAQGRSLSDTLKMAALSGIGGYVAPGIGKAVSGALGGGLTGASGIGALAGGAAGDTLAGGLTQAAASAVPTAVSEVVVNGVRAGLSIPAIAAMTGLGAATVAAIASGSSGGAGAAGAAGAASQGAGPAATGAAAGAQDITPLLEAQTAQQAAYAALPNYTALDAITGGAANWVKANPLRAAAMGLGVAGALGASHQTTGGSGGVGNNGAAGTRDSLDPRFSATSPAWFLENRKPADMTGTDWAHYGQTGEKRFFVDPNAPAPNLAVMANDKNMPAPGQGYARGGRVHHSEPIDFSVTKSDGRSDDIHAKLSKDEYVVDAETVALLGNGSSEAGAKKLDDFRVNVRKHKGRALAKGRFSVDAKTPEAYMARSVH